MSNNKFTKGEWFVVESDGEITVTCEDYDIFTCWTDTDDAGLVAAAPEMYEMLRALSEMCSEDARLYLENSSDVIELLAKARGEHV